MITKEEALKRMDIEMAISKSIHNSYSSKDVKDILDKKFYEIIFASYIQNSWSQSSGDKIHNFMSFYYIKTSKKDKFNFFNHNLRNYLDYFHLVTLSGNEVIRTKHDTRKFFEERQYLDMSEQELQKLSISQNMKLSSEEFWNGFYKWYIEGLFETIYFTYYDTLIEDTNYEVEKKIIINTLSYLYSIYWNSFEIYEEMFQKKQSISYIEFVIIYYLIWFIGIQWVGLWTSDTWETYISYNIVILPNLKEILDEVEEQRSILLDRIFDEKYNEITIKKKQWKLNFIESSIDIEWDDNKFVELKKQYPFSKIEAQVHKGNINKYKVTEKVKLKK